MKVSPQEDMTNPQGMKVFVVERHDLSEDFVYFRALCGMQPTVATRICSELFVRMWSATVAGPGRDSVFQVCVLLS